MRTNRAIVLAIFTMLAIVTSVNSQAKKIGKSKTDKPQTKETGKWKIERSKDEMTDNEGVVVRLTSDDGKYGLIVFKTLNSIKTSFALLGKGLISDGTKALVRFDEEPAFESNWALRMRGKYAIFDSMVSVLMLGAQTIRIRFEEYIDGTTTVKFDVRGLGPALKAAGIIPKWTPQSAP